MILKYVISPAASSCGYNALRADQISEPGMITSQVIQHIVDDPLVIADLTDRNPNVFYELALRHAIRKPLVQIIKKGESLPFDVAGSRTIYVDHRDLDSVEEAKSQIIQQIESLKRSPSDIETPISVSLDLQLLRQSENPEERSLGDVLTEISEVRKMISTLDDRLDNGNWMSRQDFKSFIREARRSPYSMKSIDAMLNELHQIRLEISNTLPKSDRQEFESRLTKLESLIHQNMMFGY